MLSFGLDLSKTPTGGSRFERGQIIRQHRFNVAGGPQYYEVKKVLPGDQLICQPLKLIDPNADFVGQVNVIA